MCRKRSPVCVVQFADQVESLDETAWNAASWCSGWRVRDVLAHLVRGAEMTPLSTHVYRPARRAATGSSGEQRGQTTR